MPAVILLEARPRNPANGAAVPVRLAGGGGAHPYFYDGQHWRAGIIGQPTSIARLDFDGEQLGGGGVPQALQIAWAPATNDAVAALAALYWGDAPATLRIGAEGAGLPPVDTAGLVLDAAADRGVLTIAFGDLATDLKRPLLVDRYAGTGGLEGPVEWEGQIKARAWGPCFNVPGKPLLKADNIWCFGDPLRPWRAFREVRDKGVAIAPADMRVLEWQGSAAATLAALRAAAVPSGGCVVCPSIACVKWWAAPSGDPRADIEGETEGGYVATAPEIAARLVAARSTLTFGAGEVAAAAASRPAPFGRWWNSESVTAASAVSEVLGDVGLSWVIVDGAIALRPWEWSAPVRAARSVAVSRRRIVKPIATRRLGYRRNHSPMARGDLADIVLARDVAYEDGTPIEDRKPAEKGATNSANPDSPFGPGGQTIGQFIKKVNDIDASPEGLASLRLAVADVEAAGRQYQRAIDRISEAALRAVVEAGHTRAVLRDAGIVVDQASGQVRIYAFDLLTEQMAARFVEVGITVDAVRRALTSKVEATDFRDLVADVGLVEQVLSSVGGTSGLTFTARQARFAALDGGEAGLRAVVAGHEANKRQLAAIAEARQETFAKIDDKTGAVEAVIRALVNTQVGAVDARIVRESIARIADGEALARDIGALRVEDGRLAGEITKVVEAIIAGDKATVQSTELLIATSEKKTGEAIGKAAGDAAAATDKVDKRVVDAEAAIGRVAKAVTDGDKASADTIEQVRGEVREVVGSVSDLRTVVVGPAGASVRAMTVLNAAGLISGMYQTNDGTVAAAGFAANSFAVRHPTTGEALLYVDADGAVAASFKQRAIGAGNLKDGAAQGGVFYTTPQNMVIPRGYTGQLINMTFDKQEAGSVMELLFYGHFIGEDDLQLDCRFIVDGAVKHVEPVNLILIDYYAELTITPFHFVSGLAAGQHTISIEVYNREQDNRSLTVTAGATLKCTELRQASVGSGAGSMGQVVGGSGTGGGGGNSGGSGSGGGGVQPPVVQN